jgi:hypothetical protein
MSNEALATLAPFIQAHLAASHSATNAVIENLEADVAEWKRSFADLYDWIEDANGSVDSMKINNILAGHAGRRTWAGRELESVA